MDLKPLNRIKRDFLLALLDEKLGAWFEWKKPRGGMHILIEFNSCSIRFCLKLQHQTGVNPKHADDK
jgi:DNA-binding transcriptional MocR family regulator